MSRMLKWSKSINHKVVTDASGYYVPYKMRMPAHEPMIAVVSTSVVGTSVVGTSSISGIE